MPSTEASAQQVFKNRRRSKSHKKLGSSLKELLMGTSSPSLNLVPHL